MNWRGHTVCAVGIGPGPFDRLRMILRGGFGGVVVAVAQCIARPHAVGRVG
jgi:hypothetical protein